mmetsp:Transcript_948/g.1228  ORF Transcript_948/g.1228 Transcript_948/m.1228 type:complete len:286 (-) Transcript_948:152-1009(-)|eukprot:CAMPEP_0172501048 /NCGR_PEP_ID=MMETSP1066-20121228/145685_1 /TAXON_ID=671091 /ORGANISM="Coscinodiscus wailesii, Strain CCMP2513" /LENGTH=285 /DNA_ID=CAMNT_0013275637 /DNA_START=28 /DNA_END=885 /DNA_ORIENTATION=+
MVSLQRLVVALRVISLIATVNAFTTPLLQRHALFQPKRAIASPANAFINGNPLTAKQSRQKSSVSLFSVSDILAESLAVALFAAAVYQTINKQYDDPPLETMITSSSTAPIEKGASEENQLTAGPEIEAKRDVEVESPVTNEDVTTTKTTDVAPPAPAPAPAPVIASPPPATPPTVEALLQEQDKTLTDMKKKVAYTIESAKETDRIIADNIAKKDAAAAATEAKTIKPVAPPIEEPVAETSSTTAPTEPEPSEKKVGLVRRVLRRTRRIFIKILKPWKKFSDIK